MKDTKTIILLTAAVLIISLVSCDSTRKFEKEEKDKIASYLAKNPTLNFVKQTSGLYYLEVVKGTGVAPANADSAFVFYTGKLLSGSIFDTNVSSGKPYGFIVGDNIAGFDEGIQLMKVGGKATLLIPSSLAYGAYGNYYAGISGYTPLLFDVELVKVVAHVKK